MKQNWYLEILNHIQKLNRNQKEAMDVVSDLNDILKRNPSDMELDKAVDDLLLSVQEAYDANDRLLTLVIMRKELQ